MSCEWCQMWQDEGASLLFVLTALKQVLAGLLHLHSLGIVHRDVRSASIFIRGMDPLCVALSEFAVAHRLSAFERDAVAGLDASDACDLLFGSDAIGPMQVSTVPTHGKSGYQHLHVHLLCVCTCSC